MKNESMNIKRGHEPDKFESASLKKNGWYMRYLADDAIPPLGISAITQGIPEKFSHHLNFQIVLPIEKDRAFGIFHNLTDRMLTGKRFMAGVPAQSIVHGYLVTFMLAEYRGETMLRVILPDEDNNVERGTFIRPEFELQYSH